MAGVEKSGRGIRAGTPDLGTFMAIAGLYVAAHVTLDRLTFLHPFSAIGITPWDPPQGLTMALLLRFGLRYAPAVPVAIGLGELLVRHLAAPWLPALPTLLSVVLTAGGYVAAAAILLKLYRLDADLWRVRDLVRFLAVTIVAALLVAGALVGNFVAFGMIAPGDFWPAVLRSWLGDYVGILTLAPLLLVASRPRSRRRRQATDPGMMLPVMELIAQAATVAGTVWFIFSFDFPQEIKLFYLAFLPTLWLAVRHGMAGAAFGVLLTQVALKVAFQVRGYGAPTVIDFQLLMVTLGLTGLLVGAFVSERRQVSEALWESETRLRAILNTAPDPILTVDAAGVIESANPAVKEVFGWSCEAVVGVPITRLLPGLNPETPEPTHEITGRHQNGVSFPAEVAIGHADGGLGPRTIVVTRDITRRVKAEALVRQHQTELAHVARVSVIGEMASAIAHEESQPLAAIAAYARACRLLLQAPDADLAKISSAIDKLAAQAVRAGNILNRLRDFLHRGEIALVPESIGDIVSEVIEFARTDTASHGIAVIVDLEPGLPPVMADRVHIQQVLLNLIRNAIDAFSESPGPVKEIKVSAGRQEDRIHVAVRDTGPGIDPAALDGLFTPFSTTKDRGMGLGLSISRTIVAAHGGQLRHVPGDAPGAAFHFDLQVADV